MNSKTQKVATMLKAKLNEGKDLFEAWQAVYNKFVALAQGLGMSEKQAHAFVQSWIWDCGVEIANHYGIDAKPFEDGKKKDGELFKAIYN